jgi:hypothetical protein
MGDTSIRKTAEFKMFEHSNFERPLGSLVALRASMKKNGYLKSHPIIVGQKRNGKFPIREGHHRFAAAMSLGIPFYYIVETAKIHPAELEGATKAWTLRDCVEAYCREGRPGYQELLDYSKRVKIGLSLCAAILGNSDGAKQLRRGVFKLAKNRKRIAGAVEEIMAAVREANPRMGRNSSCARAIVNLIYVREFDPLQMVNKIDTHPGKLQIQPDIYGYMLMLEEIYNHGNRTKVPLAFEAKTAARGRSKNTKKEVPQKS